MEAKPSPFTKLRCLRGMHPSAETRWSDSMISTALPRERCVPRPTISAARFGVVRVIVTPAALTTRTLFCGNLGFGLYGLLGVERGTTLTGLFGTKFTRLHMQSQDALQDMPFH